MLLGRGVECDVMLRDRSASRLHALISFDGATARLHAMGRNPSHVNQAPVSGACPLEDGDHITLPGEEFWVVLEGAGVPLRPWAIEVEGGPLISVGATPLVVGGAHDDRFHVTDLPPRSATFHTASGALFVVLGRPASLDGVPVSTGDVEALLPDMRMTLGRHTFIARTENSATMATTSHVSTAATRFRFTFQPVGGVLEVEQNNASVHVELSELRARLVAVVLSPPGEYVVGEYVADEVILSAVWPGDTSKDRLDINTLVHRVRKSLLKAGLNPVELLQRHKGGGGVRFCVPDGATVSVE
ncbi:MAG: FHA domain-containing protein [Myxococcota bacterium]